MTMPKMKMIQTEFFPSDQYVFFVNKGTVRIIFDHGFTATCPGCGKLRTIKEFGLRHMGNGDIRTQPKCGACRSVKK